MTQIQIDGVPCETSGDETLLAVLRRLGHDVPTLCNDDRLAPQPLCRMCVVEVSGLSHLVTAYGTRPWTDASWCMSTREGDTTTISAARSMAFSNHGRFSGGPSTRGPTFPQCATGGGGIRPRSGPGHPRARTRTAYRLPRDQSWS